MINLYRSIFGPKTIINSKEYNLYIDTGIVSERILEEIAQKIIKNTSIDSFLLTPEETAILVGETGRINEIIIKLGNSK